MKTSTKKYLFVGLTGALLVGLFITDRFVLQRRGIASFDGQVSTNYGISYYDLTELSGSEFNKAFKTALVQGLQVHRSKEQIGISLGLFQIKNEQGAKVYACEVYPNVEVTLQAEGVAYHGNVPTITVRGPCQTSDDGQKILPFMLPLKGLHKTLRENPSVQFPINDRGENFSVFTQSLFDYWPQFWNVTGIKLYNSNDSLSMTGYEIIYLLDDALTLDFAQDQ